MKRIALIGDNSVEYVRKLLEIWNNGASAVLIDWRIPWNAAVQLMRKSAVSECIAEQDVLNDRDLASCPDIHFESYVGNHSFDFLSDELYGMFQRNDSLEEALVIFSSGTTGKSKGVILSHFALTSNAEAILDYLQLNDNDTLYMVKTISHLSSITGELLVSLLSKTKLLVGPVVVPPRLVLSNIEKNGITRMCVNPTILRLLLEEQKRKERHVSSLKEIYIHGAHTDAVLGDKARTIFPSCNFYYEYGLSEAGPRVASQKAGFIDRNSVGMPISGVHVVIVSEEGKILAPLERGLIHVHSPGRFSGYISGTGKHPSLYQDWLNTGDIGYVNQEGELYVCGRIDDVINLDAHKIYPSDIEELVLKHTNIAECIVDKAEYEGKTVLFCAYQGTISGREDLLSFLQKNLLAYEIPKVFVFLPELPKNRNGKICRENVREMVTAILISKEKDKKPPCSYGFLS